VSGFRGAVSFLTRVPVADGDAPVLRRSIPWFPVVGALVGLGAAGVYAAARVVVAPSVAAALSVGASAIATGALHEDGLADTVDALGGGVRPATGEGSAAAFGVHVSKRSGIAVSSLAVAIGFVSLGFAVVPVVLFAALGAVVVAWLGVRTVGGVTGDLLGAIEQVTEISILLLGAAAAHASWRGAPWWP
jgi:adenosylcobinamide-GDP ribazoletransferase